MHASNVGSKPSRCRAASSRKASTRLLMPSTTWLENAQLCGPLRSRRVRMCRAVGPRVPTTGATQLTHLKNKPDIINAQRMFKRKLPTNATEWNHRFDIPATFRRLPVSTSFAAVTHVGGRAISAGSPFMPGQFLLLFSRPLWT